MKLILLTVPKNTKYQYDLYLDEPDIPRGITKHPTKEGHDMIASKIISIIGS